MKKWPSRTRPSPRSAKAKEGLNRAPYKQGDCFTKCYKWKPLSLRYSHTSSFPGVKMQMLLLSLTLMPWIESHHTLYQQFPIEAQDQTSINTTRGPVNTHLRLSPENQLLAVSGNVWECLISRSFPARYGITTEAMFKTTERSILCFEAIKR